MEYNIQEIETDYEELMQMIIERRTNHPNGWRLRSNLIECDESMSFISYSIMFKLDFDKIPKLVQYFGNNEVAKVYENLFWICHGPKGHNLDHFWNLSKDDIQHVKKHKNQILEVLMKHVKSNPDLSLIHSQEYLDFIKGHC